MPLLALIEDVTKTPLSTLYSYAAPVITAILVIVGQQIAKRYDDNLSRVKSAQYKLKHESLRKLLAIIDSQVSRTMKKDNDGRPVTLEVQEMSPADVLECHNLMLLSVNNNEILSIMTDILYPKDQQNIMEQLTSIRQLIRKELGFSGAAHIDKTRTWLGGVFAEVPSGSNSNKRGDT